ncbi:MAG: hypothetical protein WAU49_03300 [Steroidobacteraceae bacterium]
MTARAALRLLYSRRLLLICCAMALGIVTGTAAWFLPREYESKVLLVPVVNNSSEDQLGGLGSLASQFGGLASLAGLNLEGSTKKAEFVAVLQSEALTQKYIADNDLLPILYAKKWDPLHNRWKVTDQKKIPTLWQANRYFNNGIRTVATDQKTGLVTLTITWKNPQLAATWANGLVEMANDYLREKAITESERNIAYLTDQASKTDQVGVKEVIYSILQTEISKVMLARGNTQYAFTVVDPAFVPERPSSLGPEAWALIGFIGGCLLATAYVIGRQGFVDT